MESWENRREAVHSGEKYKMFQFCPWENRWNSVEIFPLLREKWLTMEICFFARCFPQEKRRPIPCGKQIFCCNAATEK